MVPRILCALVLVATLGCKVKVTSYQGQTIPGGGPFIVPRPGNAILVQTGHLAGRIAMVRWAPDGSVFATSDGMGVQIRDGFTGALRGEVLGERVEDVEWSPDGSELAVVSSEGVMLWNMRTRESRYLSGGPAGRVVAHHGGVLWQPFVYFSPDGSRLLTEGLGTVHWDLRTGSTISRLDAEIDIVQPISWSAKSDLFALRSKDTRRVSIFDGATAKPRFPLSLPRSLGAPTVLQFSPKDHSLAIGGKRGRVALVDADGRRSTQLSPPLGGPVTALAWHPSGDRLAIGLSEFYEGSLVIWNPGIGKLSRPRWSDGPLGWDIVSIQWAVDGRSLAIANSEMARDVLNTDTETFAADSSGLTYDGVPSPDLGRAAGLEGSEGPLAIVDLGTGKPLVSIEDRVESISNSRFERQDRRALVESVIFDLHEGVVQRAQRNAFEMDVADFLMPRRPEVEEAQRAYSAPSSDGSHIVAARGTGYGDYCLYDLRAKRCDLDLAIFVQENTVWRFSPGDRWLAVLGNGGGDRLLAVIDTRTGKPVTGVSPGSYRDLYWIDDQVLLLASGSDDRIRLVRPADGASLDWYAIGAGNASRWKDPRGLLVRDDGTFDGDEAVWDKVLVRMGDDIAHAPLVPLPQVASKLRRPGLLHAFLAGQ